MTEILKPGFRWIFTLKSDAHAQTALALLKTFNGYVLQMRAKGSEIRWSTSGDVPRLVEVLSRLPGELKRRRLSENCHPKILLHAPADAELARLREAASRGGVLADRDLEQDPVVGALLERAWMAPLADRPRAYVLTELGQRWVE